MSINNGYGPTQRDLVGSCCNTETTLEVLVISFSVFVALLAVFVYARCLIQRSHAQQAVARPSPTRSKVGLDASAIASLPSFAYRRPAPTIREGSRWGDDKEEEESAARSSSPVDCAVCLSSMEEGELMRLLPMCDHMFHAQCIDLWLSANVTCPVCRTDCDARNLAEKVKTLAAVTSIA